MTEAQPAAHVRPAPPGSVQPADTNPTLVALTARVVLLVAVGLSLYQLYTAGIAALTALVQRSIHLGAILTLTFLLKPPFKRARKDKLTVWYAIDWALVAASLICVVYICVNLTAIFDRQGDWLFSDLVISIIGTLLVLEACRRVIGLIMTGICVMIILYAMYGPYMPDLIIHKGYSIERIATTLWLTTEGIFGLPIGVAATFVFVFILFGAFLEVTGGGNFFIDLAYALTGRFSGGPAKASVVASGFMGSVSGSAVGNVVATGSFTIPMMKRVGYRPHVRSRSIYRRSAHAPHHGCGCISHGGIHQHQLSDHHQGGPYAGCDVLPDGADLRPLRSPEMRAHGTTKGKPAPGALRNQKGASLHCSRGHPYLRAGGPLFTDDGRICRGDEHPGRQPDGQHRTVGEHRSRFLCGRTAAVDPVRVRFRGVQAGNRRPGQGRPQCRNGVGGVCCCRPSGSKPWRFC